MEYVSFILRAVSEQSNMIRLLFKHSGWRLDVWVSCTPILLIEIIFILALFIEYCSFGHYSPKILYS